MDTNYYQIPVPQKKQNSMELAALVLAIISLVTTCCIYLAFPCGALAVILAFLSQGKSKETSSTAKIATVIGIIGMVTTVVIIAASLVYTFGSGEIDWNTYMQEYEQMLEMYSNYETL